MSENKINIICNYASEYGGNFIPSLLKFAEISHDKCDIVFTFPKEAENRYWAIYLMKLGYKLYFIDSFKKKIKFFKSDICRINKENGINIVLSQFISGLKMKIIFLFQEKTKLIIHIHSDFSGKKKLSWKAKAKRFIEKHIRNKNTRYIFVSKQLRDEFGVSKNTFYLPNGISAFRIPCEKMDLNEFCLKNNIDQNKTIILSFGWSPFVKGTDLLVKAFLSLDEKQQKEATLLIIHGRNNGFETCINYLEQQIGNKDFLNNKSIVFASPVKDVFSLYELSDVFVSSSRSEGFSYSLLEAMYFNLFCISSDIDGVLWSKKYDKCEYYSTEDIESLSILLSKYISLKKEKCFNQMYLDDFDIRGWAQDLLSITLG